MLRRDGFDFRQRDVARREVEIRVAFDHDLEPLGDEILELARDYRRHEGDNGGASISPPGYPNRLERMPAKRRRARRPCAGPRRWAPRACPSRAPWARDRGPAPPSAA